MDYLLTAVNASTSSNLTTEDVTGVWAGLRPLLAPTKGQSDKRTHGRPVAASSCHRLGRRRRARDRRQVDDLSPDGRGRRRRPRPVRHAPSRGSARRTSRSTASDAWRPSKELETHLYRRFGEDTPTMLAMIDANPRSASTAIAGLPYVAAEFVFSAREEMSTSLIDLAYPSHARPPPRRPGHARRGVRSSHGSSPPSWAGTSRNRRSK